MEKIIVKGRSRLEGQVRVSGSKNAALPIIFACLITDGISEIKGLPDIGDVRVALKILEWLGAQTERKGDVTFIDTRCVGYSTPAHTLISRIRASTYLIGSCLSRFGKCEILPYGGCNFALRPIDMHISACLALGADFDGKLLTAKELRGAVISFNKKSVGATVNALLLSACAEGETVIEGAATEPHIDALANFLVSAGADIRRCNDCFYVKGGKLHGGKATVIGDMIEAGSYLAAGLITEGKVRVTACPTDHMKSVFDCFSALGAKVTVCGDTAEAEMTDGGSFFSVNAAPYPGFPTDLQPIMAPLMARYCGGKICDTVWRERFGYLKAISKFGVKYSLCGSAAKISKSVLIPAVADAPDLRGGMACILCALAAEGTGVITSAKTVLRGYEDLTNKLCALGAEIKIE